MTTMTAPASIRKEFYDDLLSDSRIAVKYWYDEETPQVQARVRAVTRDDIAKAWRKLVALEHDGTFCHCNEPHAVRDAEMALQARNQDALDYDACVADAVVQLAVLGEIIYS